MKKFKSFNLIFLILILMLSFVLFSCKKKEEHNAFVPEPPALQPGGKHEQEFTDSGNYVVKDGQSAYKIVVPEKAEETEILAANELKTLFQESTGIVLPIVSDSSVEYNSDLTAFSVGKTSLLNQTKIQIDKTELKEQGFKIITNGRTIFLCGASELGTLYSVYEFLSIAFNFDVYYTSCIDLDTNVTELKLMNYNILEVPDFDKRVSGNGFITEDKLSKNRMRLTSYTDCFVFVNGREVHNTSKYLPKEVYGSHPDWFGTDGKQLCMTARGNATEYELMVTEVANVMKSVLKTSSSNVITFTQEDTNSWCSCSACAAEKTKYGTDSAVAIKFCNAVNKKIQQWMKEDTEGKLYARDLNILFFAYEKTTGAPVNYDYNLKKYVPMDQSVVCDKGVYVFYAPIDLDYMQSINAEVNQSFKENFDKWSVVSEKVFLWLYSTDFNYFLAPYDSINYLQELYRYSFSIGTDFMYNQGQHNQHGGASAWHILKAYLSSKLMWNVNADVSKFTDKFFTAYFGEAAIPMREFYESQRVHLSYIKEFKGYGGLRSVYIDALKEEYWPRQLLTIWQNSAEQALSAIEPLAQTNPTRYIALKKHIIMEKISVDYMLIKIYSSSFSEANLNLIKKKFKEDVLYTGITRESQYSSMAELFESL